MSETPLKTKRRRRVPQDRSRRQACRDVPDIPGRGGVRRCAREGCGRLAPDGDRRREHCSYFCVVVSHELTRAQRICEATGDTRHWVAAVALSDALTEYYASDSRVYSAAREVGITDEQWRTIKHGADRRATDTLTGT